MKNETAKLYKNVILNTYATFVYFFSQWLLTIIITRLSGYDNAGTFTLAVSFSNIFSFISKFGMRGIQVGDIQYKYSNGQYFTSRVLTSIASIIPFAIALYFCNYRVVLRNSCIAMMCYKLLEGFDDVVAGTFQRLKRYKPIAVSYTLKAVLTLAVIFVMLIKGCSLSMSIWGMTIAFASVLVFYDFYQLRGEAFLVWSTKELGSLIIQCIPLVIVGILDSILLYLPRNAIEQIYGAEELGYYGSISIFVVVLSTLAGAVWGIVLTRYSEIIQEKKWKEFNKLTGAVSGILLAFGMIVIIVGSALGPFFFRLLYGEKILSHMYLLIPVLCNALLLLYNSFFNCIFIPLNHRNALMVTDIVSLAVCVLCVNRVTLEYGSYGACVCLTASLLVRFILLVISTVALVRAEMRKKV